MLNRNQFKKGDRFEIYLKFLKNSLTPVLRRKVSMCLRRRRTNAIRLYANLRGTVSFTSSQVEFTELPR